MSRNNGHSCSRNAGIDPHEGEGLPLFGGLDGHDDVEGVAVEEEVAAAKTFQLGERILKNHTCSISGQLTGSVE